MTKKILLTILLLSLFLLLSYLLRQEYLNTINQEKNKLYEENIFLGSIDNIISYWKLDESSGNPDDAVSSNNLSNSNATFSSGKINNGAVFNGSNAVLSISDASQSGLDITGDITISLWIKPDTLPATNEAMVLVEKGLGTGNTEAYSLRLQNNTGTQRIQFFTYSDVIDFHGVNYNTTLSTESWTHIVGRFDGSTWKIFINNSEVASASDSQAPIDSNAAFNIGSRNGVQFFDGMIDEVGIWNRDLTTDEITQLYNSGNGLQYPFEIPSIIGIDEVYVIPHR